MLYSSKETQSEVPGSSASWRLVFAFPSSLDFATISELHALSQRSIDFELENTQIIAIEAPRTARQGTDHEVDDQKQIALSSDMSVQLDSLELPFEIRHGDMAALRALGLSAQEWRDIGSGRTTWLIDPDGNVRASLRYPFESARSITELLRLTMAVRSAEARDMPTPEGWKPGDDDEILPPFVLKISAA